MQKHNVISLITLACLILFATSTANAQSNRSLEIRIPFDFVVPGGPLPAGDYAIERVDPTKPNVLMFKNNDDGTVRLFITQRVENNETITSSCLIFKRWKSEYQLFQIWVVGNNDGNQVPSSGNNRRHKRGPSSLVRLKSSDSTP